MYNLHTYNLHIHTVHGHLASGHGIRLGKDGGLHLPTDGVDAIQGLEYVLGMFLRHITAKIASRRLL
jgi:hypothetical protein